MTLIRTSNPIDKCPVEVISNFLLLTIGSPSSLFYIADDDNRMCPSPVGFSSPEEDKHRMGIPMLHSRERLRLVCHQWNDIVEGNPHFWCSITWSDQASLEYLQLWLERSRPMKIQLSLYFPWGTCGQNHTNLQSPLRDPTLYQRYSKRIVQTILPFHHSLQGFQISTCCGFGTPILVTEMIPLLVGDHLHALVLQQSSSYVGDMLLPPILKTQIPIGNSPTRYLTIEGYSMALPANFPIMSTLTGIEINFDGSEQSFINTWGCLSKILEQALALQIIRLIMPSPPSIPLDPLPVSTATSLSVALGQPSHTGSFIQQFRFPCLENLSLNFITAWWSAHYSIEFQSFLLPRFMSLQNNLHAESLLKHIKHLCITTGIARKPVVLAVLQALQDLEVLILHSVGTPSEGTTTFLAILFDRSLNREMSLRKNGRSRAFLLCPKLRRLESLNSTGVIEPKFVHCRRRLGLPLSSLVEIKHD